MFCISVLRLTFKSENPCFVYLCSKTYVKRICVVHMCSRIYVMTLCFQAKQLFGVKFLQPTLPVHHSSDSISMSGSLVQAELNCFCFFVEIVWNTCADQQQPIAWIDQWSCNPRLTHWCYVSWISEHLQYEEIAKEPQAADCKREGNWTGDSG